MTQRQGMRVSTAHAYLHPHASRSNLHVMTSSQVTRVLFDANKGACHLLRTVTLFDDRLQLPLVWSTVGMAAPLSQSPLAPRCTRLRASLDA